VTLPELLLRHILPECSDKTELWSFVVHFCELMSLMRRDGLVDLHVDGGVWYASQWKVQDKSHFK